MPQDILPSLLLLLNLNNAPQINSQHLQTLAQTKPAIIATAINIITQNKSEDTSIRPPIKIISSPELPTVEGAFTIQQPSTLFFILPESQNINLPDTCRMVFMPNVLLKNNISLQHAEKLLGFLKHRRLTNGSALLAPSAEQCVPSILKMAQQTDYFNPLIKFADTNQISLPNLVLAIISQSSQFQIENFMGLKGLMVAVGFFETPENTPRRKFNYYPQHSTDELGSGAVTIKKSVIESLLKEHMPTLVYNVFGQAAREVRTLKLPPDTTSKDALTALVKAYYGVEEIKNFELIQAVVEEYDRLQSVPSPSLPSSPHPISDDIPIARQ